MGRGLLAEEFLESVDESEYRGSIETRLRGTRHSDKGIVRAKNQRISIEKEKAFVSHDFRC
jgi:hypothetical protein